MKKIALFFLICLLLFISCAKKTDSSDSLNNSVTTKAVDEENINSMTSMSNDSTDSDVSSDLEENVIKEVPAKAAPVAKGNFVKDEESVIYTKDDLSGSYDNVDGVTNGELEFSIKLIWQDVYFEIKEDGEERLLSTIKSLTPSYVVIIETENDKNQYDGIVTRNGNDVLNVVGVSNLFDVFAKNRMVTITIENEYGSYHLGSVNTSEIEGLRFDKELIGEALGYIEDLMENEEYERVISLLKKYRSEYQYSSAYRFYNGDAILEDAKSKKAELDEKRREEQYQNAIVLFMNGNYEEALNSFENCGSSYKDCKDAIIQCNYGIAKEKMEQGRFLEAVDGFSKCGRYLNSMELLKSCNYYAANELMAEEKYAEAKELLKKYEDYSNSKDLIRKCNISIGAFEVGDIGPAGGYVFYDKGNYSDGWRYLEVAPSDLGRFSFGYYRPDSGFYYSGKVVGTGYAIGTGKSNTKLLVDAMGDSAYIDSSSQKKELYAAKVCFDYVLFVNDEEVYDDWFLPSREELNLVYKNLSGGKLNFSDIAYWSSSEDGSVDAWAKDMNSGKQLKFVQRKDHLCVRPIRAF